MLVSTLWAWDACVFLPMIGMDPHCTTLQAKKIHTHYEKPSCVRRWGNRLLDCETGTAFVAGVDAFFTGSHLWIVRGERLEIRDEKGMWRLCDAGLIVTDIREINACDHVLAGNQWLEVAYVRFQQQKKIDLRAKANAIQTACRKQPRYDTTPHVFKGLWPRVTLSLEKKLWLEPTGAYRQDEVLLRIQFSFDWPFEYGPRVTRNERKDHICAAALRLLKVMPWLQEEDVRNRAQLQFFYLINELADITEDRVFTR